MIYLAYLSGKLSGVCFRPPHPSARTAVSISSVCTSIPSVFFVKRMTAKAMSFLGINSSKANPSQAIDLVRDYFKVGGIYASTYTAQVIALVVYGRDVLYEHLVHQAIDREGFAVDSYVAVSLGIKCSSPQPAGTAFIGNSGVDLNLAEQFPDQGQVGAGGYFEVIALAVTLALARRFAFFTGITQAVRRGRSNTELKVRFFDFAPVTDFGFGIIEYGHRCLQLGNVT